MADFKTSAIIPAAGASSRLIEKSKKQFIEIDGKPLIYFCLNSFQKCSSVNEIVLVVPKNEIDFVKSEIVDKNSFTKVSEIIVGGKLRQDSVKNGFDVVMPDTELVIIHDAARPFVDAGFINKIISEAGTKNCVISAIPVKDTLKIADKGIIKNTTPRKSIWRAQTPQAFKYEILKDSYQKVEFNNKTFTDEAQIVEYAGYDVHIVEGSEYNFKITSSEDLRLAGLMINNGMQIS
ncbi:MAG: 2-C-methyl-D-erythritol 4-phosphate cytidylyltransferase [Thermodesulfobacteriota bacterium]